MPSSSSSDPARPPMGLICIEAFLHRPPGDPFHEKTWPFPLIRERAENSHTSLVVSSGPYDDSFIDRFVDAGQKLADRGAVGIITSCGFLAMAQNDMERKKAYAFSTSLLVPFLSAPERCDEAHAVLSQKRAPTDATHHRLAARLPIPIATSSLLQIPSALAFLAPDRGVGILTYDDARLGPGHLARLGLPAERCPIRGVPAGGALRRHIAGGAEYVHEAIAAELVATARALLAERPDVAALCLECTNMPPFTETIQAAVGVPVYDVVSMANWFYSGLVQRRPERWGPIMKDTPETRT